MKIFIIFLLLSCNYLINCEENINDLQNEHGEVELFNIYPEEAKLFEQSNKYSHNFQTTSNLDTKPSFT